MISQRLLRLMKLNPNKLINIKPVKQKVMSKQVKEEEDFKGIEITQAILNAVPKMVKYGFKVGDVCKGFLYSEKSEDGLIPQKG